MNSKFTKPCMDAIGNAADAPSPTKAVAFRAAPEAEVTRGSQLYLDALAAIHAQFQPGVYLEIGIRHGVSLALANRSRVVVGIDPAPELRAALADHVRVISITSDQFFADNPTAILDEPVDLAFIDGMHLFEFALRDFMNVECHATTNSVIVFDDIFPNHPLQAERERQSGVWTGDVWKIVPCLRKYRPDLRLFPLDAHPAGLLVVANLDPRSQALRANYHSIVAEFTSTGAPALEAATLSRAGALAPNDPQLLDFIDCLKRARQAARAIRL